MSTTINYSKNTICKGNSCCGSPSTQASNSTRGLACVNLSGFQTSSKGWCGGNITSTWIIPGNVIATAMNWDNNQCQVNQPDSYVTGNSILSFTYYYRNCIVITGSSSYKYTCSNLVLTQNIFPTGDCTGTPTQNTVIMNSQCASSYGNNNIIACGYVSNASKLIYNGLLYTILLIMII